MYKTIIKRTLDVVFSILLLPAFFLVFLLVAPLIVITDGLPIFYNSKRRGKNGKSFFMFKFRTMKRNAPDIRNSDGSTFNSENDPRITKFGRIIRKLSIDELPQIVNILIGDMSFIGPRPNLSRKNYEELDDIRKKRLSVRPGITGYSQAYFRNSITQDEKYYYDCYYVDNLTLFMDLKILIKTIQTVVMRKNIFMKK